jgi:hypothetical protein
MRTRSKLFAWTLEGSIYSRNGLEPVELASLKEPIMKKNDWKYLLDALLFVDLCSIAAIGLLLAFVIPSGRAPDTSKYFLGLHRHDWGNIHLYLALFLLVLLVLHLWLNWTWVVHSTKNYFGSQWKNAFWALSGAWIVVLFLGWLIVMLT